MKIAASLAFALYCSGALAAPDATDAMLIQLVQRHVEAQRDFDQAALKSITADNYVEVSPIGDVDGREKMLGFYAADQKRPAPQLKIDEQSVRVLGDTAIILARLTYTISPERTVAMRAGYVAQLKEGDWKLVSAQYTGIRPPKN